MASRPGLAALIVAHKLAGAREVDRVMRGRGDVPLWRALIDEQIVTGQQLFELLRDHAQFPVVGEKALASPAPVEQLVRIVPREDALRKGILPLEVSGDGKRVQFAMIDPTDEAPLRELAKGAALQAAKVSLIEVGALASAVERVYQPRPTKEPRATVEPAGKVGHRSELEAAERLERVLVQAATALGGLLELELVRGSSVAGTARSREASRLAREVARELGLDRRRVALAGVTAMLVQLDATRRARRGEDGSTLFDLVGDEVGWAGGGEDGLLGLARSLTSQAAGFGRQVPANVLQRVVQSVADFLALGGPDGDSIDLGTAEQLLRASSAGSQVVDALMRILHRDAAERTPAAATELPEAQEPKTNVAAAKRRVEAVDPEDRTRLVSIPHGRDPQRDG